MRDQALTRARIATPSDTDNLSTDGIGLYVGVAGDLKVTTTGGDTVILVGLVAGVWHPFQVKKIFATGTVGAIATDILVGW